VTPRPPQASRPGTSSGPSSGSGRGGRRPILAPIIALLGLIVIAAGSLWTVSVFGLTDAVTDPTQPPHVEVTPDPSGVMPSSAIATPTPTPHATIVITPPPDRTAEIVGQILFSKDDDIYRATGKGDIQVVTRGGKAVNTAPTWTPDGKRIVFVQTREKQVDAPYQGKLVKYTFFYPNIVSIPAEGGDVKTIYESLFPLDGGTWHRWVLQPAVSPDGNTIALVSDGVDGYGDVMLSTMTIKGGALKQIAGVPEADAQGHNDPAWSPDGKQLAFTYNSGKGQVGTPKIGIYTLKTGKTVLLKPGYANPSWSPDGRVIAAERTTGTGRDIVLLDVDSGTEIVRLSNDGDSFAPTFSPNGDQIAFLRRKGLGVDLWIMTLDPANGYSRLEAKAVTQDGGLDAQSPPSWFIPEDQRKPVATPAPASTDAPDGEAEASPAP
jgi:Tol biopolymer transport system component